MKSQVTIKVEIDALERKLDILLDQAQEACIDYRNDLFTRDTILDYCDEERKSTLKQIKLLKWVLED